jgi:hypothetical protein
MDGSSQRERAREMRAPFIGCLLRLLRCAVKTPGLHDPPQLHLTAS